MARVNNLTNFLTDVATAIKTKKGSSTAIPAANFDTEILALPSQGIYQTKEMNITTNGNYEITPDENYDAMDKLRLSIDVPTGGSGDIKLFETEQAMQADENPQEGDLAVVYRSEVQPLTATTHFSKATFPETVVLNEALEDSIDLRFGTVDGSWFECWGMIDPNTFEMSCYGEQGEYRVQYESQDGLTYTRTALQDPNGEVTGNELDFGVEIYYEYEEMWNDVIGNFILVGGNIFEGLYKYGLYTLDGTYKYMLNTSNLTASELPFKLPDIDTYTRVNELKGGNSCTQYSELVIVVHTYHLHSSGLYNVVDTCTVYQTYGGYLPNLVLYNNHLYANASTYTTTSYPNYIVKDEYNFSLDNPLVSTANRSIAEDISSDWTSNLLFASYNTSRARGIPISGDYVVCLNYLDNVGYSVYNTVPKTTSITVDNTTTIKSAKAAPTAYKYLAAPTQLNLTSSNQLLPSISAYGKNEVITGDESLYNNLSVPLTNTYTMDGFSTDASRRISIKGTWDNTYIDNKLRKLVRDENSTTYVTIDCIPENLNRFYISNVFGVYQDGDILYILAYSSSSDMDGLWIKYNLNTEKIIDYTIQDGVWDKGSVYTDKSTGDMYLWQPNMGSTTGSAKLWKISINGEFTLLNTYSNFPASNSGNAYYMGVDVALQCCYFMVGAWVSFTGAIYKMNFDGTTTRVTTMSNGSSNAMSSFETDTVCVAFVTTTKKIYYFNKGNSTLNTVSVSSSTSKSFFGGSGGYKINSTDYVKRGDDGYLWKFTLASSTTPVQQSRQTSAINYNWIMKVTDTTIEDGMYVYDKNGVLLRKKIPDILYNAYSYSYNTGHFFIVKSNNTIIGPVAGSNGVSVHYPVSVEPLSTDNEGMLYKFNSTASSSSVVVYAISDLNKDYISGRLDK